MGLCEIAKVKWASFSTYGAAQIYQYVQKVVVLPSFVLESFGH